jgi:hypothetical protein
VRITNNELNIWKKDFMLILAMGSPDSSDADPIIDLFSFITSTLGSGNRLYLLYGRFSGFRKD